MIIKLLIIFILILLIILTVCLVAYKYKKKNNYTPQDIFLIADFCLTHDFVVGEAYIINKHLALAVNEKEKRFAIIKMLNPKNKNTYSFIDFPLLYITKIKPYRTLVELSYIKDSGEDTVKISPANKEVRDFLHRIFQKINFSVIQKKYSDLTFDTVASSDWRCTYLWAFCSKRAIFVYFDTEKQFVSHQINLLKTNLTLDIKYSYFEMSIYNINQQLLVYENDFYDNLFTVLLKKINEKYACILKDKLYYDNNNNVVYLTNSINSLQVVNLDTVEEVYYSENKISFKIIQNEKMINFVANKELVNQFEDFVINYNLKKIANNFNFSSDKLVNTSENTKLLIDYTRSRMIYCANLNTIGKFTYCTIAFDSIRDAECHKNGRNTFVRIYIDRKDILDVTCTKSEVAYYILAQIKIILNESSDSDSNSNI